MDVDNFQLLMSMMCERVREIDREKRGKGDNELLHCLMQLFYGGFALCV